MQSPEVRFDPRKQRCRRGQPARSGGRFKPGCRLGKGRGAHVGCRAFDEVRLPAGLERIAPLQASLQKVDLVRDIVEEAGDDEPGEFLVTHESFQQPRCIESGRWSLG